MIIKISYNYEEMIKELKEDMSIGILLPADKIQILRFESIIDEKYKPIIDWYYNKTTMSNDLVITAADNEDDIKEKMQIKLQYEEDKPFLQSISVADCINEMEE